MRSLVVKVIRKISEKIKFEEVLRLKKVGKRPKALVKLPKPQAVFIVPWTLDR